MKYRALGKTGLQVSEIGLGGEWLERCSADEVFEVVRRCEQAGINILDCWMPNPEVRSNIGAAIAEHRDRWIVQGHIGATWQDGQYVKTRDLSKVRHAFEDLLTRFRTDYMDLGMIHYVDEPAELTRLFEGEYMDYVRELKAAGKIRHIGLSTHNPDVARAAALSGLVEVIMFSVNPAFDMMPPSEDLNVYFKTIEEGHLERIAPERRELYQICAREGVGITVMKGFAGGRLLDAKASPFGTALTPVQCIHYALTRPAVASVLAGYSTEAHVDAAVAYETASETERDYTAVLASVSGVSASGQCTYCGHCAPCPEAIDIAMVNKLYDLAAMQAEVPASVRAHYRELAKTADDCIGCGGCEERCPFGVAVVARMAKARALFQ